ncbi:Imm52 family immunity protein [Cupriavidus sp.]|uniref:Imm52 family immunity protein n=1 Tax=Cupriavidus sp. TaxID=1873897 RepID=UPI003D0D95BD
MDTFKRFNFKLSFDKQRISRVPVHVQIDRSLTFLKAMGQIDPILKNWLLCAEGKDDGLTHNVLLDQSSLLREIESWKDSDSDVNDMSFVLWNGVSNPLKGGLSITYHARSGGSLPAYIEFSEAGTLARCLQDPRQGIVELMNTAADLWPEIYWGVAAPNEYLRKQRVFQDRQTVGWIGYCPHPLSTADFPNVAELRATQSQGTIIVSCPGIMDEKNVQHVKVAGETDIKLVELGLLPARY